jgi:arginyl-tRNA synthetase
MNIYNFFLNSIITLVDKHKKKLNISNTNNFKNTTVENPPPNFDFDLSCNIALILAKINNLNPQELAKNIKNILIDNTENIEKIEIAGPGFLNIKIKNDSIKILMEKIFLEQDSYGAKKENKKYNIEFVSANPTGPMHVGHCRGAIFGDVLSNLLVFNGNNVTKEYYINDYGNQIRNFSKSVFLRIREIIYGEKFVNDKDLYPGDYIIDIAKKIIKDNPNEKYENFDDSFKKLSTESLFYSMEMIKADLQQLGIKHDNFISETELVAKNLVNKSIKHLKDNQFVEEGFLERPKGEESKNWKKTKRLIFKSTIFKDDTDRALTKNDGSWTYFANDIAYHMDKVSRKYDYLINILGADHTGYVKRITAAVSALSLDKIKLECKICQLVKLYKKGKPFKMSKRAGDFISVNDLLKEVDKDSIRFMMLNRSNDVELDFDFDKVLEKSKDNPVYYVQYCYARINSLFRSIDKKVNDDLNLSNENFVLNSYEAKILRKIFEWPKVINVASNKYEPHRIPFYLYELSTLFHSYWSKGNENEELRFIKDNKIKNNNSFAIIKLVALVIRNGMRILGVSLPSKM